MKAKYRTEILKDIIKKRTIPHRRIYDEGASNDGYELSKNTFYRIINGEAVGKKFAVVLAHRLGIVNPNDLINPSITFEEVELLPNNFRSLEKNDLNNPKYPSTTNNHLIETQDGWELSLLDKEKHSELLNHMHNNGIDWHCYHETILPNGQLGVIRSRLEIEENGVCTFHHGKLKFPYKGTLFKDENLVLFADTPKNGSIKERIIYRYLYIPDSEQMYGTWYGLDFPRNHFAGRAIISTNPNMSDQEFLEDKNHINIHLGFRGSKKEETTDCISWEKKWNTILLEDSMEELLCDEYAFICSSFIPNAMRIKRIISDKAEALERNNPKRKLRIRMMFINPDAEYLVKARFGIRGETRHYINEIKGQVNDFLKLARTVSSYIDLDIRLYESWPFSHYFQFGHDIIYYALMLPDDNAESGTMFIVRDKESKHWRDLNRGILKIHRHSKKVTHPYSFPEAD